MIYLLASLTYLVSAACRYHLPSSSDPPEYTLVGLLAVGCTLPNAYYCMRSATAR